jgi:formyltetrahydrofolate deformylase
MAHATLLLKCRDRPGIVARLSGAIFENGGNILASDQYTTPDEPGRFFIRVELAFDDATHPRESMEGALEFAASELDADWTIHYDDTVMRMAIAVSKADHCLVDLLYRVHRRELRVEVPLVVSNHEDTRDTVERYGIPFHHLPVTKETRAEQEAQMLDLIDGSSDFLVLARYMQILTGDFLERYGKDVINIHHSFLPSFKGADPYRQAYERGVKIIGATAHFATTDLDEGPIIEQVVGRVTHKDSVADLRQTGRDLEKIALSNAVRLYTQHRVIRDGNKTIILG